MGNLLLQGQYLEAEKISDAKRNDVIKEFCKMVIAASKAKDKFCVLNSIYEDDGIIYRFMEDWDSFKQKNYGRMISHTTYQQLYDLFSGRPNIKTIRNVAEFESLPSNKAEAGFCIPELPDDIIVDVATWRLWCKVWFLDHPEDIDWKRAEDEKRFFVNVEIVNEILEEEIKHHLKDEEYRSILNSNKNLHDSEDLGKPLKHNYIALLFHKCVMESKARGGNRQGYAKDVADKICGENYYHEAPDLSAMEKDAAPANNCDVQRAVYFIRRNDGTFCFISIDFEKGVFEFHKDDGTHLGEFHFDGSFNSKADETGSHNLRCVNAWKKKHNF